MKFQMASTAHEVAYQELVRLLKRNGQKVSSEEMLCIAANMIGKLIALQDQRTMTREQALEIVQANIELGNEQAIAQMNSPVGTA
jgi:hypothetical protein